MAGLEHGERNQVRIEQDDGSHREVTVYDHVTISEEHYVNSVNGYETFHAPISAGDSPGRPRPEAVTKRISELLWVEFGIDVETMDGIEIVDMESENVHEA